MVGRLLFVSLAVVTLASCKKDKNDTPAYNLSAKVHVVKTAFTTAFVASKDGDASTGYTLILTAVGRLASSRHPSFPIYLEDAQSLLQKRSLLQTMM